jgi:uncharacterized DUF497 family protein
LEVAKYKSFDWDSGNIDKNLNKHGLDYFTIEEIFFNQPLIVVEDFEHSEREERCYSLGRTDKSEVLFTVFTIRNDKIRVISSRKANRKEREIYEEFKRDTRV